MKAFDQIKQILFSPYFFVVKGKSIKGQFRDPENYILK